MDHTVSLVFGILVGGIGLCFLLLSLLSAIREVFPPQLHLEQMKTARGAEQYAALLSEIGKLKTWLALAAIGIVLIFVSGYAPLLSTLLGPK